jgi:hypothetical protein
MRNIKLAQALVAAMVAATASMVCSGATAAGAGDVLAQAAPPAGAEGKSGPTLRRLFAAADANHDGKLTKDEARGWLPITYENFERLDVDKRGHITFEQFMAFTQKRVNKQADDILHLYDPASRM